MKVRSHTSATFLGTTSPPAVLVGVESELKNADGTFTIPTPALA
jgi:hypothetical protein